MSTVGVDVSGQGGTAAETKEAVEELSASR
jgi:hypothetical protein